MHTENVQCFTRAAQRVLSQVSEKEVGTSHWTGQGRSPRITPRSPVASPTKRADTRTCHRVERTGTWRAFQTQPGTHVASAQ